MISACMACKGPLSREQRRNEARLNAQSQFDALQACDDCCVPLSFAGNLEAAWEGQELGATEVA